MKFFKTIKGAFNHISKNAKTGKERTLNGVLMFGMSVYAWADVVTYSGVHDCSKSNEAVYYFADDNEIIHFIEWLQRTDNYLVVE